MMNVNAAKCRITANSYGPPMIDGTLHPNFAEYQDYPSFSHLIENERTERSRRYSYNTYHPDARRSGKHRAESASYRGWPENTIPWGRIASDRIHDVVEGMVKQGSHQGRKKFDGRPQSSPGTTRRPYSVNQEINKGKKPKSLGKNTIRLIYNRPPAPEPSVDMVAKASSKSKVPQSLVIVLGKTTPSANNNESSKDAYKETKKGTQKQGSSQKPPAKLPSQKPPAKLPSYYLGETNDFNTNLNRPQQDIHRWSPSFSIGSSTHNNNECDNCGLFPRPDVGSSFQHLSYFCSKILSLKDESDPYYFIKTNILHDKKSVYNSSIDTSRFSDKKMSLV